MSTTGEVPAFSAVEAQTRFLYPFTFASRAHTAIRKELLTREVCDHQKRPIWREAGESYLYAHELMPQVHDIIFGTTDTSWARLEVTPDVSSNWFRKGTDITTGNHDTGLRAVANKMPAVELFLNSFGAGVLSVRFSCRCSTQNSGNPDPPGIQRFNYLLSQLQAQRSPRLSLPGQIGQAPTTVSTSILERMGTAGQSFSLPELVALLLEPLLHHELKSLQGQTSLYTVVRLGSQFSLDHPRDRQLLGPLVSALAQAEEPGHAGAVPGEIPVPYKVFNRCHMAAVSTLGVAHIVMDQPPDIDGKESGFNPQRVSVMQQRYFLVYLWALMQRVTLSRFVASAATLVPITDCNSSFLDSFSKLRQDSLSFAVQASLHAVSSRDALNRFYELCSEGLRIGQALSDTTGIIEQVDHSREAIQDAALATAGNQVSRQIHESMTHLATMQEEVGVLEMFFVAVYTIELVKTLAEGLHLPHEYSLLTSVLFGLLAIPVAYLGLKRWRRKGKRKDALLALALAVAMVAGWVWAGKYGPFGVKRSSSTSEESKRITTPNAPQPPSPTADGVPKH